LIFSGGSRTVAVTGNFTTSGSGSLSMTTTTDSLDINGNATFGGGASTLSAGRIRLAGNFSQTTTSTAFAATGSHRTVLDGAAAQSISFANPTTSFFRRLEVPAILHTVTLQTDVQVTDSLTMFAGGSAATMVGAGTSQRLTVGGLLSVLQQTSSPRLAPPVLELSVTPVITPAAPAGINPDTTVFLGTIAAMPTGLGISYKSIRVNTSGNFTMATDTIANDLVVTSGTAVFSGTSTFQANGKLRTAGTGALSMTNAGATVTVADSAIFGGGSTSGLLTAGTLVVRGNFSQSGNAAAFAASGTHSTRLDLPGSAVVQNIFFTNPTTSFFDSLDLNRGTGITRGTVNFQTDARIIRGLSIQNSTDVTGPTARITIAGGSLTASQSTTSPTMLTTRALELSVAPNAPALSQMVGAVNISPDTVVINAGITTLPVASGLRYNSIRINTGATITMSADTIANDLDIATGTASFPGSFMVNGNMQTRGTGAFGMPIGGAPNLIVAGNATFGGASTAGLLLTGNLRLRGTFVQTGTNSFQASAAHSTVFEGSGVQTVNFAAPGTGAAQSTFGNLFIGRAVAGTSTPTGITLASNIFIAGTLQDSASTVVDSILGAGFTVTAAGGINQINAGNLVFNNALLSLTNFTTFTVRGLTFRNMNSAATYLTMTRSTTGADSPSGINFATPVTTGKYFNFTSTANYTWTVTSSLPAAASMTGNYVKSAAPAPTVTWNSTPLP
jgi:hypothetical protein